MDKQRHVRLAVLAFIILAGAFVIYVLLFKQRRTAAGTQTANQTNQTTEANTPTAFIPTTGDSITTATINLTNSDNTLAAGATQTNSAPTTTTNTSTTTNQTVSNSPGGSINPPPPSTAGHHPPPPPSHRPNPPGPVHLPPVHQPSYSTYAVKAGDTLASIARRFGLSWQQLYSYGSNKTTIDAWARRYGYPVSHNPADNIFVGESLQIPGKEQPL